MFQRFFPDDAIDSAYEIDYEKLYEQGIRGVLYDIDNTLVPHGAPADERAIAHFNHLQSLGMGYVFLSNNKEGRVKSFSDQVGGSYIFKANKPSVKSYLEGAKMLGLTKEQVVFVGDQLFTDVWGAKRAGIFSYLVKPIHPKEEIQIVLKRKLEKIVLYYYEKSLQKEKRSCR